MKKWMLGLSLLGLVACGDDGVGTVTFTTYGEDFIEKEIPASAFAHGWTVKYSKFLIMLGEVKVSTEDETAAQQGQSKVYDVHKPGPVWLIGWGTPTIDAETIYGPLFRTGSNLGNYHNPEFDKLFDEAQTTMDEKKRLALYHQISKMWVEDAAVVPLYQQLDLYGASQRLTWKARSDERIKAYDMSLKDGK